MKSILSEFKGIGVLELMFALFPIVAGYGTWGLIWAVLLIGLSLIKRRGHSRTDNYVVFCFIYVFLHSFVVIIINNYEGTAINRLLGTTLYLLSIIIVPTAIRYEKLVPSLYLIAVIASLGLIFQFVQILAGKTVSPIALPFLPAPDLDSRLWSEIGRPSSFFWEPSSFVTYLMIPLFISLINRNVALSVFFFLCILLSTSSNGIFMAPIMIGTYVFTSKAKTSNKIVVAIALVALMLFFFQSSLFDIGKDKIENTVISENVRISNGPTLVSQMPISDLFFGIKDTSVDAYIRTNAYNMISSSSSDSFFLSDFWYVLVVYGVVGLLLHLLVYFRIIRIEKELIPYLIVLLIAQFSQGISFRSMYVYQMVFIWSFVFYKKEMFNS